jgi:hypothetical protein
MDKQEIATLEKRVFPNADTFAVRYLASQIHYAARDLRGCRDRVIRYGEDLVELASNDHRYAMLHSYNPDPVEELQSAIRKRDTIRDMAMAMSWATGGTSETSGDFDAWYKVTEEGATRKG